jgi:hypothetical protein
MYTITAIMHGTIVALYRNNEPWTRRHEAVLAKAQPQRGLDPFAKRLTGATTFGEIQRGRDIRFTKKRAGKKKSSSSSITPVNEGLYTDRRDPSPAYARAKRVNRLV